MRKYYKMHVNMHNDNWENNKLKASAIQWVEYDSKYLYTNNNYQVSKKDFELLGLPSIDESKDVDLQDAKIYRFPKLILPRQKVDLLKERYNCKVIRDLNKADIAIVSLKLFDSVLERTWTSSISCYECYLILKYMKELDILTDKALKEIQNFLQDAPKGCQVDFRLNKDWSSTASSGLKAYEKVEKYIEDNELKNMDGHSDWILPKKNYDAFNNLLNVSCQLVLDTTIGNIIDSELAVIDNTKYDEIEAMVTSSDIENRSLAVEMLANCNIEKSFDVVSGLYFWQYDWFKATNNWNSVNVKALRARLKQYEGNHNTSGIWSFNCYLKTLAKDRKLTRFAVDKTREKLMNTLMKDLIGKGSQIFKVDINNLYIADEIENMIDE